MPVFNVQISPPIGPSEIIEVDADTIGQAWVQAGREYPEAQLEDIEPSDDDNG
jgi:hypothetical protein